LVHRVLLRVQQQFAGDGASGRFHRFCRWDQRGCGATQLCVRASRLHGERAYSLCQQHLQLVCSADARAVHAFIYTPGGALRSRKTSFFGVEVQVRPNLTGLLGAAAQGDAHGRLPASPAPQLAGSPVRPGRGSPSGRGLPRAVASGPTTPERDNPAWFRAWL